MSVDQAEQCEAQTSLSTAPAAEETAGPKGSPAPEGGLAVLHVLRHRPFAIFWTGQAISLIGTWMQGFAQGQVVPHLTDKAFALGLVNFCSSIPTLILMPVGGVAADRLDRRRILIATQWAAFALAIILGTLYARGVLQLWHVMAVALALGVVSAYEMPSYQAFYPQLVEKRDLSKAISLNQATFHGARIIGPAIAGFIAPQFGLASAFYLNALSFVAVIIALSMIRTSPPEGAQRKDSFGSQMREGIEYVKARPDVMAILALTGVSTLCIFTNLAVLMPYYATFILNDGTGKALGAIMSASGVGAMTGSILLLSVPRDKRVLVIAIGAAGILTGMSIMAHSHNQWVSVGAAVIQSTCISLSMGLSSVMVQEWVPDRLRGRVMSLYMLMFMGIMPFSSLFITFIVDRVGMRQELQAAAVIYFIFAMVAIRQLHATHDPHAEQ